MFLSLFFIWSGHPGWHSCNCLVKKIFKVVLEEVNNSDVIASMMEMYFHTVFWKYVNPTCGGISQLTQDGLLTNEVMDPFLKKKYFPENVMKIIYIAIEVYKDDKKTKDEIESFFDN